MSDQPRKHRPFLRGVSPKDPAITPFDDWLPANQSFLGCFRKWLHACGYSIVSMKLYGVAVRQALGYLNKPYWQIDPQEDLDRVWEHLKSRPITASTLADYHKGLLKLAEYLRLRCHLPPKPKEVNWEYFIGSFPGWLQEDIRALVAHCRRSWMPDKEYDATRGLLCELSLSLRWMVENERLEGIADLTPQVWYAYLDQRLFVGQSASSLNRQLSRLKHLVAYLKEHERPVCERFLKVDYLEEGANLPKDVPLEQLRILQRTIHAEAASSHAGKRRSGRMDLAWFLLMLHSGLRTGEVRRLRLGDIDWAGKRIRIEQSKGLKDRLVFLSQATIDALSAYLDVRGPTEALPDQMFVYRHLPLSNSYCYERLRTYGKRCGVTVKPHQLRHSCATLLLNAGAPVLTVQSILGHKWVDTTLGYARLYDGTVAADYYQAMAVVERQMTLPEDRLAQPPNAGQLLALVDSLREGTLNEAQAETVQLLRVGIMAIAENENYIRDVKVLIPGG